MKSCTTVTWHSQSLRRNPPTASLFLIPLLPSAALKMASQMVQWVKNLPAMQEAQEVGVSSLGQEDPLERGNLLQYSCLENPIDRATSLAGYSYRVTKSQTQLSD